MWSTRVLLLAAALGVCLGYRDGPFRQQFAKKIPPMVQNGVDPGKPLFLTPYLESGDITTARRLSLVGPLKGADVKSYSGFLTVNKQYNSNMFFWFFPAQSDAAHAPVVLWLQGGPGGTSMFGLFVEHGPFSVTRKLTLIPKKYAWTKKYSMLYIDNPVGTGFSFTENDLGYASNQTDVAENLYSALTQFFTLFSELKNNDFYATGESYAGKYVPAIAYKIHMENLPHVKINLRGIAIGDGLCDPLTMTAGYPDFMFNVGLVDENQREYIRNKTDMCVRYIKAKQWMKAFKIFDELLNGDTQTVPSYFTNITGSTDYYNYQRSQSPKDFQYYNDYLALPEVRAAIHVGNLEFHNGSVVEQHLLKDIMKSVKPWIAVLMNYYKVLIYSGQLDVIIAFPLTESFLQTVPWQYLDEYKRAKRSVWKVRDSDVEVAGYVRRVHDFYQVMVRGGGHILPYDQPERAWDMIDRFIMERPFSN